VGTRSHGPSSLMEFSFRTAVVKIFKCVEGSRSSMMDVQGEHNHMRAAFGLRDWFG